MKYKTPIILAVLTICGSMALSAGTKDAEYSDTPQQPLLSTDISGSDLDFFTGAARGTALVAQISELASKHAVTPEVQALAAGTAKEQADDATGLRDLAQRKHVPLSGQLDGEGRKLLQTLEKLKGAKFDKTYLDALGEAHDALQTSLQAGVASQDKDIKAFAQAGLDTLKQERERVRKLGM